MTKFIMFTFPYMIDTIPHRDLSHCIHLPLDMNNIGKQTYGARFGVMSRTRGTSNNFRGGECRSQG